MTAVMPAFDTRDRALGNLRVLSFAAGILYAFVSLGPGPVRRATLAAFLVFGVYGALLYFTGWAVGWRTPEWKKKGNFYAVASALDLVFVAVLMGLTGGARSPFYRALYLWVAIPAFYSGLRGGRIASAFAFAVFLGFEVLGGFPHDAWLLCITSGGILMHGPLIGYLVDRERVRAQALELARDEIERANRRIVEEQAKFVQAEKLASIGLLASGVAHEINNPLSGVQGCVKALAEDTVPEAKRQEFFDTIQDGLSRMRLTVEGLLDFARQRPPSRVDLYLHETVHACLRLLAPVIRKKDLRVKVRIDEGVRIWADRSQLMQAALNVLVNAAYVSPQKAEIAITTSHREGQIGVSVADAGPGISKEVLGRVCDPFFTTKPEGEGTGLGLAVTLGILRAHGGDLEIESEVGEGTQVTLWLPREGEGHA